MKLKTSNLSYQLARSEFIGPIVRLGFGHFSWLFPVKRLTNTPTVIAFYHPKPTWQTHILLIPKVGIPNLLATSQAQEPIILEILLIAHGLAKVTRAKSDSDSSSSLIVNGGTYQDVAQLHFHLAAGPSVRRYWCPHDLSVQPLLRVDGIEAFHHPYPVRTTHIVLRFVPTSVHNVSTSTPITAEQVHALITMTRKLVHQCNLTSNGFSLIASETDGELDYSCFHLVSGNLIHN